MHMPVEDIHSVASSKNLEKCLGIGTGKRTEAGIRAADSL